jgi:hypothetical protein
MGKSFGACRGRHGIFRRDGPLGSSVETPDWTVFREHYDATVRHLLSRGDGRNGDSDASVLERLRRLVAGR